MALPHFTNRSFFAKFWPVVAQQVTSHRAGADADILPLLRRPLRDVRWERPSKLLGVDCGCSCE